MKEISVSLWEAAPVEINELPEGTQYLVFDPKFRMYGVRTFFKNCKVPVIDRRKYFLFDDPDTIKKEN